MTSSTTDTGNIIDPELLNWSTKCMLLPEFVQQYTLPQIVRVEEGYCAENSNSSLSCGELLNIHSLTTEKKLFCYGKGEKQLHFPVHDQKISLKPPNYDTVYQRVADLAQAKHVPKLVQVTRGYINVEHHNLSVDAGEILYVININQGANTFSARKNRSITFRNSDGALLKLPYDCSAGFKPLLDNEIYALHEHVKSSVSSSLFPFYFQFNDQDSTEELGVLEATALYEDRWIIATSAQNEESEEIIFMIPQNLQLKVKVAAGTMSHDMYYESIIKELKSSKSFEVDVRNSSFYKKRSYTSCNVDIYTIHMRKNDQNSIVNYQNQDMTEVTTRELPSTSTLKQADGDSTQSFNKGIAEDGFNADYDEEEHLYEVLDDVCIYAMKYSQLHESTTLPLKNNDETIPSTMKVEDMSVEMLSKVLQALNMSHHIAVFVDNQVDGSLFCELDEEEIKELGLNKFEIKKLIRFKDGWRPKLS